MNSPATKIPHHLTDEYVLLMDNEIFNNTFAKFSFKSKENFINKITDKEFRRQLLRIKKNTPPKTI